MKQKTIWMLLLIFGILNSFLSCKGNKFGEKITTDELRLVNHTTYDIAIKTINIENGKEVIRQFEIPVDTTLMQIYEYFGRGGDRLIMDSDSVIISFGTETKAHFAIYETDSKFNILNHHNYNIKEVSDDYDVYTYVFTEEDVANAKLMFADSID